MEAFSRRLLQLVKKLTIPDIGLTPFKPQPLHKTHTSQISALHIHNGYADTLLPKTPLQLTVKSPPNTLPSPHTPNTSPNKITISPRTKRTPQNSPQSKTNNPPRFNIHSHQAEPRIPLKKRKQLINIPSAISKLQLRRRKNLLTQTPNLRQILQSHLPDLNLNPPPSSPFPPLSLPNQSKSFTSLI